MEPNTLIKLQIAEMNRTLLYNNFHLSKSHKNKNHEKSWKSWKSWKSCIKCIFYVILRIAILSNHQLLFYQQDVDNNDGNQSQELGKQSQQTIHATVTPTKQKTILKKTKKSGRAVRPRPDFLVFFKIGFSWKFSKSFFENFDMSNFEFSNSDIEKCVQFLYEFVKTN